MIGDSARFRQDQEFCENYITSGAYKSVAKLHREMYLEYRRLGFSKREATKLLTAILSGR